MYKVSSRCKSRTCRTTNWCPQGWVKWRPNCVGARLWKEVRNGLGIGGRAERGLERRVLSSADVGGRGRNYWWDLKSALAHRNYFGGGCAMGGSYIPIPPQNQFQQAEPLRLLCIPAILPIEMRSTLIFFSQMFLISCGTVGNTLWPRFTTNCDLNSQLSYSPPQPSI